MWLTCKGVGAQVSGDVYWLFGVFITKREKAESEAQRGKPEGTLESEIQSAISLLGQRPPRCTGVGMS